MTQDRQTADRVERTDTRILGFSSSELDFQLMRSLGAANFGGAAPGEVFAARGAIGDGDVRAWPIAFEALGRSVAAQAEHAKARGHEVSARDHFWRASMYYRAAEYFSDPFSQEMHELGLASRRAFLAAAELMTDRAGDDAESAVSEARRGGLHP